MKWKAAQGGGSGGSKTLSGFIAQAEKEKQAELREADAESAADGNRVLSGFVAQSQKPPRADSSDVESSGEE